MDNIGEFPEEDNLSCACWMAPGMQDCPCEFGKQNFNTSFSKYLAATYVDTDPMVIGSKSARGLFSTSYRVLDDIKDTRRFDRIQCSIGCGKGLRVDTDLITRASPSTRWQREITLTQPAENLQPYDLISSMRKIVDSAMFNVKYYLACVELTEQGTPHIHLLVASDAQYFNSSKIKAFHKYRYSCNPVKSIPAFINYILKKKDCALHIDYCKSKGIEQFYASSTLPTEEEVPPQI